MIDVKSIAAQIFDPHEAQIQPQHRGLVRKLIEKGVETGAAQSPGTTRLDLIELAKRNSTGDAI